MARSPAKNHRPIEWLPTGALHDLRHLLAHDGPFFTALVPTPSAVADADRRFEIRWRNARRQLETDGGWDEQELEQVDDLVASLSHATAAAIALVHPTGGATHVEYLDEPVHSVDVTTGALPRLAPLIESRQRAVPHVVVETDRTGADITAFDGGTVIDTETVEGETMHIHRGHPGGWSQRRFQQRAENRWEANAGDVADAVGQVAASIDAQLVVVAGDVRAKALVLDSLDARWRERAVEIDSGAPEGIAAEVVRLVSDVVAGDVVELSGRFREALVDGLGCTGSDHTLAALATGRVDTLLVHDDRDDDSVSTRSVAGFPPGVRVVDLAIAIALRSGASVVVVPSIAPLEGPIGGLLRW